MRFLRYLAILFVLSTLASGCQSGVKAGARCRTADFGDDGAYVLRCVRGRWTRVATKTQVAQLLLAVLRSRTTTASPATAAAQRPGATKVTVGDFHSCALMTSGTIRCWGDNQYGQLGDGTTNFSTTPVTVTGITTATQIALGGGFITDSHSCALLADGTIKGEFNRSSRQQHRSGRGRCPSRGCVGASC